MNRRGFRSASVVPAPPPSGIPVATTTNVIVTFGDTSGINYARSDYPAYTFYAVFNPTENISFQRLTFNYDIANTWSLVQYSSGEDGGLVIEATNPSTDSSIIPTTGWTYTLGTGPAITITAAPSGIPVASTSSIAISGYGTLVKRIGGQEITGPLGYGLTIYDGVAYTNLGINPNAYVLFGPPPTNFGDMFPSQFSEWTLYSVGAYEGGDTNAWLNGTLIASSTSNDINTIPTTGWSPAITITAA
jgi:hypothetical protein